MSVHPGNSTVYRLASRDGGIRFLKVVRPGWTPSPAAEARRLSWAGDHLPVPEVLATGAEDDSAWLLTRGLDGLDATDDRFRADVPGLVARLAHGLRRFHETPRESCPFQFRLDDALRVAQHRLANGRIDARRDFHAEFAHLTAEAAVAELVRTGPDSEELVVCHGDYCAPNILLADDRVVGYVDLGELGVADRWWDLAVATWSVTWNFGPGYEPHFLKSYGITADDARIRFYRLLYDVVS